MKNLHNGPVRVGRSSGRIRGVGGKKGGKSKQTIMKARSGNRKELCPMRLITRQKRVAEHLVKARKAIAHGLRSFRAKRTAV